MLISRSNSVLENRSKWRTELIYQYHALQMCDNNITCVLTLNLYLATSDCCLRNAHWALYALLWVTLLRSFWHFRIAGRWLYEQRCIVDTRDTWTGLNGVFYRGILWSWWHWYCHISIDRGIGGVAVGRWTRHQEVAGSTPTAALFGQQPWASSSHLMCLCSPSSIIWYLARAFMLKAMDGLLMAAA